MVATTESKPQPAVEATSRPLIDYYLVLISVGLLISLGMIMVLSASSAYAGSRHGQPYIFAIRQAVFLVLGLVLAVVFSRLKPSVIARLGWLGWGLASLLLLLVVVLPSSIGERGNTNWLAINSQIAIQPSEFTKLAIVVWAAAIFAARVKVIDQPKYLIWPFVPFAALLLGLVLVGRDLGTAMVLGLIVLSILWFIGTPMRILGILGAATAVLVGLLVLANQNRIQRILVWLNPSLDPDIAAQPTAALYALATGGWWGVGLGGSRQKWGGLQDGAHTDFIFAVIGEELGLFGVICVLLLFGTLGFIGLRIALRSDHPFTRILAAGLSAWFVIQATINILVVLNVLPVLGIPLPFISYGGSALVANLIGVGMLLSCARNEPEARKALAAKKKTARPRVMSLANA